MLEQEQLARYQFIEGLVHQRHVLEVGCGSGRSAAMLADLAKSVVSLDADAGIIAAARRRHLHPNVAHVVAQTLRLPVAGAAFDLVLVPDLSPWGRDLAPLMREVRRVLREGGHAVFSLGPQHGASPSLDDLDDASYQVFEYLHIFGQIPFRGSILADLDPQEELEPALDCTLVQEDEEPTHYMAICASHPVEPLPYTVVQMPPRGLEEDERTDQRVGPAGPEELPSALAAERGHTEGQRARAEAAEHLVAEIRSTSEELRRRAEKAEQRNDVLFARLEQGENERSQLRQRIAEVQALRQADQWEVDELKGLLAERESTEEHPSISGSLAGASFGAQDPGGKADEDPGDAAALREQVGRLQTQLAQASGAMSELEQLRLQLRAERAASADASPVGKRTGSTPEPGGGGTR